jgi:hypothetical protein
MIKVMAESEDVSSGTTVSFNPPVYMQRYDAVLNLSDKQKPKKVRLICTKMEVPL